jgi:NAD(P)-dependent dehydrogenase (short-subunit alcohol dehydrogenase family)
MDLTLHGKAVLVTGGSRGIGRFIALAFAGEGADVAICARNEENLSRTGRQLSALGVRTRTIVADLFQEADCRAAVDQAAQAFGRLDVLINNASTNVSGSLLTAGDDALMERLMGKTLASMRCARAAIPHLRRAGGGRIICIGGLAARNPGKTSLPSGLGNAALANFVKHLSDEVAADGILVNVVHPAFCKTDRFPARVAARARERGISAAEAEASFAAMFPIGRIVEPADIAPLVLFLASPHAGAITGQSIAVDGGMSRSVSY